MSNSIQMDIAYRITIEDEESTMTYVDCAKEELAKTIILLQKKYGDDIIKGVERKCLSSFQMSKTKRLLYL